MRLVFSYSHDMGTNTVSALVSEKLWRWPMHLHAPWCTPQQQLVKNFRHRLALKKGKKQS